MVQLPEQPQTISRSPSVNSVRSASSVGSRGSIKRSIANVVAAVDNTTPSKPNAPEQSDRGPITGSGRIKHVTRPGSASSIGSTQSRK